MADRHLAPFLALLTSRQGSSVTFAELALAIWPSDDRPPYATDRERNQLSKLRRAAVDAGYDIASVRSVGYRLQRQPNVSADDQLFVGRDREVRELNRVVRQGNVVSIVGLHGYGKSTLARWVATQLSSGEALWPRQVKYETFGGARSVSEPLRELASRNGLTQTDPLPSLVQLFANRVDVLVLDQAEEALEACQTLVEALMKEDRGTLCVVVTSVVPLGRDREEVVRVSGLDCEEPRGAASQLFAAHYKGKLQDADWDTIREVCAARKGNPRLIELAAGQSAYATLAEIAKAEVELDRDATTAQRNESDYRLLSKEAQDVLGRLTVFSSPFALSATTAEITGVALPRLSEVLEATRGTFLRPVVIDRSRSATWWTLDPFVRGPAERHLSSTRAEAGCRRRLLRHARQLLGTRPVGGRLAWVLAIDREYETLVAAIVGADLHEAAHGLFELVPYWVIRGRYADGRDLLEARAGNDPFVVSEDSGAVAELRIGVGFMQHTLLARASARANFEQGLELARTSDCGDLEIIAHYGLALLGRGASEREIVAADPDAVGALPVWVQAELAVSKGWRQYRLGDYAEAEKAFIFARRLASELEEQRSECNAFVGLTWVERRRCELDDAMRWIERANALAVNLEDIQLQANVLNARVEIYRLRGDTEAAEAQLGEWRQRVEQGGLRSMQGRMDGSEGELRRDLAEGLPDLDAARDLLESSLQIARQHGSPTEQAWRLFGLAILASLEGRSDDSRRLLETGFDLVAPLADLVRQQRAGLDATEREWVPDGGTDVVDLAGRERIVFDAWQAARFRQRLARHDLLDRRFPIEEITYELCDVAAGQLARATYDDLCWTLLDLSVAVMDLTEPAAALCATLHGARIRLHEEIGFASMAPERGSRSGGSGSSRRRDPYERTVRLARTRAEAILGPGWDRD